MTNFTDDDLKRLKECVDPQTQRLDVGLSRKHLMLPDGRIPLDETTFIKVDLVALLARLEAAENLAKHDHCGCYGRDRLEEIWLKSTGENKIDYPKLP